MDPLAYLIASALSALAYLFVPMGGPSLSCSDAVRADAEDLARRGFVLVDGGRFALLGTDLVLDAAFFVASSGGPQGDGAEMHVLTEVGMAEVLEEHGFSLVSECVSAGGVPSAIAVRKVILPSQPPPSGNET